MSTPRRPDQVNSIHLQPRYYRWFVEEGVAWTEANTDYGHLDWRIPLKHIGLVLVDVWQGHYLTDTADRINRITDTRIVPLVNGCRSAGLQIIHAPSPRVAHKHPAWVGRDRSESKPGESVKGWPPAEFRSKSGTYESFARPREPRQPELDVLQSNVTFHPSVLPEGSDIIVATGDELQEYCHRKEILFLLYAGFCTNGCILVRDYGTLAMIGAGYNVVLVRDCTDGMESHWTQDQSLQTEGAILMLEMFGGYSVSSDEILSGFDG